jgi:hypothetical protein
VKRPVTLFVLALLIATASACKRERGKQNVCPIDGAAPEWTGRRNGNSCEYFHYHALERQTHSWWAECELAAAEKQKQK